MSSPLYVCSSNPGKLREFEAAAHECTGLGYSIAVLPGIEGLNAPEETGSSFEENAILKADYYSQHSSETVLADDSGLEVDALSGAPGVYSARFAGAGCDDQANNWLLLERLGNNPHRAARFVCVVALARQGHAIRIFRGTIEGEILFEPRGEGGFGYDSLFYYPPLGKTLAELDVLTKLAVSHRGHALRELFRYLTTETR